MLTKTFGQFINGINNGTLPAWVQKATWKFWYSGMARRWKDNDWTFMNYGWAPSENQVSFDLKTEDEKDRPFIGLYFKLAQHIPLSGKTVLEVGSGRGGGASYIARYYNPEAMIGIDFSPAAVKLSAKLHQGVANLSFKQGDAEALLFEDNSIDVILNVESSHCYANMDAFVSEVQRVLKPGGLLGWVDIRGKEMMEKTERAFQASGLILMDDQDISSGVVAALDLAADRKASAINKVRVGSAAVRQFAAMPGTPIYNSLKNGAARYLFRVYRK